MRFLAMGFGLLFLLSGCHYAQFSHERVERREIETSPLRAIELTTFNGAIEVTPSDSECVELEIHFKGYGATPSQAEANCEALDCVVEAQEGSLMIRASKPADQWMGSAAFVVKAPKDCQLNLRTSNGRITAERFPKGVEAQTSNGAVTLVKVGSRVSVKTSNGTIRLEDCQGEFSLNTSNGRVFYSGKPAGMENRITTSNGRVELRLPPEQSVQVATRTSNGSIRCSLPTQRVLHESKREFKAVLGNGEGEEAKSNIDVRTSNGSIQIDAIETDDSDSAQAEINQDIAAD